MKKYLVSGLALAGVLGIAGAAYAATDDNDAAKREKAMAATVSLSAAVAEAERATGGKAAEADIDDEGQTALWEVEVLTSEGDKSVMVDMTSGQVVKIAAADEAEDEKE